VSLRAALEAKQRRRAIVPVQVADPSPVLQEIQSIAVALSVADEGARETLRAQLEDAQARLAQHYADVHLAAMPSGQWEAAVTLYGLVDGRVPMEALAALVAESCVDEELRDAEWWTEQLNKDSWSDGDIKSLEATLLHLNVIAPDARLPKD
jgi:hypothetical protein